MFAINFHNFFSILLMFAPELVRLLCLYVFSSPIIFTYSTYGGFLLSESECWTFESETTIQV